MRITKILLMILFFTLPLVHGRVFQTIGFDFGLIVSGNFEFSKAIYFNIFSALILGVFLIEEILIGKKDIFLSFREKYVVGTIFVLLCVSTAFSLSPFTSLIGDTQKGHTFFLISHLLGLYIIIQQLPSRYKKYLIWTILFSGLLVSLGAVKELYYPRFDYGALENRALGSFGHPNYLSGFLLLLLPFTRVVPHTFLKIILIGIFLGVIILCKSLIALFLACVYIVSLFKLGRKSMTKIYFLTAIFCLSFIVLWYIGMYYPEKLHSFLSRWYLWKTTLHIIFSDIHIVLFGAGLETLPYYFNSYKVPELYIFENFGYTADRPHNFMLNIFYHFGLLGISMFVYLLISLYKNIPSYQSSYKTLSISVIVLFLVYGVFHYFSVASYIILVCAISLLFSTNKQQQTGGKLLYSMLVCISIVGAFGSYKLYVGEIYYDKGEYTQALHNISHPRYLLKFGETAKATKREGIISERNIKTEIMLSESQIEGCKHLLQKYPSVENYFYCGELLERQGEITLSQNYYTLGLSKLPDLWNSDSPYWDRYFIKHTITGNRFFSKKFGNIPKILLRF